MHNNVDTKTSNPSPIPWHAWLLASLFLLYGLAATFDYLSSYLQGVEYYRASGMTESQITYFTSVPVWAEIAWALSVWAELVAAFMLFFRSSLSWKLFALSVVGNIFYAIYLYFLSDGIAAMGAIWFMPIVITLLSCAMLIYSRWIAQSHVAK